MKIFDLLPGRKETLHCLPGLNKNLSLPCRPIEARQGSLPSVCITRPCQVRPFPCLYIWDVSSRAFPLSINMGLVTSGLPLFLYQGRVKSRFPSHCVSFKVMSSQGIPLVFISRPCQIKAFHCLYIKALSSQGIALACISNPCRVKLGQ